MAEPSDDDRVPAGFEPVHIESDWYDGPRCGLADVDGVAHYFHAVWDFNEDYERGGPDEYDEFFVWPASESAMAMEREQWVIFAEWFMRYEAGTTSSDTHPAHQGTNRRFDELNGRLAPVRVKPENARRLRATWHWGDRPVRYPADRPVYWVKWSDPSR